MSCSHPTIARANYSGSVTARHDIHTEYGISICLDFSSEMVIYLSIHQTTLLIKQLSEMIQFKFQGCYGVQFICRATSLLKTSGRQIDDRYTVSLIVNNETLAELESAGVSWLVKCLLVLTDDVPSVNSRNFGLIG